MSPRLSRWFLVSAVFQVLMLVLMTVDPATWRIELWVPPDVFAQQIETTVNALRAAITAVRAFRGKTRGGSSRRGGNQPPEN